MLRELNDRSSRLGPTMPTMAPDQRAALELVLRQGRSYGELADLLGMPEETIRTRARGGASALAPDLPTPSRSGEIADWLLGQQSEAHGARTRALLLNDPEANDWAGMVASALRMFPGGESVPELPTAPDEPTPRVNGTAHAVGESGTAAAADTGGAAGPAGASGASRSAGASGAASGSAGTGGRGGASGAASVAGAGAASGAASASAPRGAVPAADAAGDGD